MSRSPNRLTHAAIHYALQPCLLIGSVLLVIALGSAEAAYPVAVVSVLVLLTALERWRPARPEWSQSGRELIVNLGLVVVILSIAGTAVLAYQSVLGPVMADFRTAHGLDVWPLGWPMVLQILLAFFMSEFLWYWLHRAEHRYPLVWRAAGHGTHHSFQHLGALHFSANHPFEVAFLLLPTALIELLLGAGVAATGASVLLLTNAAIAHTNLDLNTRGIGWIFTTNRYHWHHHSRILEESNTNYGCSVILWDRIFGTFSNDPTKATGTGDREPSLLEKMWMPFREPPDTTVAPG